MQFRLLRVPVPHLQERESPLPVPANGVSAPKFPFASSSPCSHAISSHPPVAPVGRVGGLEPLGLSRWSTLAYSATLAEQVGDCLFVGFSHVVPRRDACPSDIALGWRFMPPLSASRRNSMGTRFLWPAECWCCCDIRAVRSRRFMKAGTREYSS